MLIHRIALVNIIILLARLSAGAQTPVPIRGQVTDSLSGDPLEEATLSFERMPGGVTVQRLRSNRNGFQIRRPRPGNYRLITTYLGYQPDTTQLAIPADSAGKAIAPMPFLGIRLHRSSQPLMEVVVRHAIPPAIVRNDTIAFNAGAYPTRPNASLEDLLKHLPGVEIDENGNVTMQGKKVDKIYLDGKEFFLGDIRTATQNLPADIVAQVEAFDSQSDRARRTGIREDSKTKSLNIKLKKDRKNGVIGNAYAGAGNDDSYSAGLSVIDLAEKLSLLASVNGNNINNQFDGKESNNGPGGGGLQTYSYGNLNFRGQVGEKFTATVNSGENQGHALVITSDNKQTFLTDSSLIENRLSRSTGSNSGYRANAFLEFHPDSLSNLSLRGNFNKSHSDNEALDTVAVNTKTKIRQFLSSSGTTDNSSHNDGYSLDNFLDYSHRFLKQGRSFYLSLLHSAQSSENRASLYSNVITFDSVGGRSGQTQTNQRSAQHSTGDSYNANLVWTEPLYKGHILDFNYNLNTNQSRSDKESFDLDSADGKYDLPDSLTTNRFFNRNTTQHFALGYDAEENKFRYQFGIGVQFSSLLNENSTTGKVLKEQFTNWFPRATLIYNLQKNSNLIVQYNGSSSAPTIDQLQPIPDLTNPFLVRLGNPGLQQQFTHNFSGEYSSFNGSSLQNFQVAIGSDYTQHRIAAATNTLPGGIQQVQYINVEGTYHVNANLTYGFPLYNKKGNASASIHGSYGQEPNRLNGIDNSTRSTGWGARLNANYHPAGKFYLDVTASADFSASKYTQNPAQNTRTGQQAIALDGSYEFPGGITLSTAYQVQLTNAQPGLPAYQATLWNAALYKNIFHDHAGQIRLSAFDLLNAGSNYSQSTGPDYLETRQTNLPGRLWLLSFVYRFRHYPHQPSSNNNHN